MTLQKHLCILTFFKYRKCTPYKMIKANIYCETLKTHFYKQHATKKNYKHNL